MPIDEKYFNHQEKGKTMSKETKDEKSSAGIARDTMTGDLRDCLLDFLKHEKNPLPWNMRTEDQQSEAIEKCTKAAQHAAEKAVSIIAADGRAVIKAKVDKVLFKDGIKAEVTMSKSDPLRHQLADAQGDVVLMVVADVNAYEGERKAARPAPDQPDMIGHNGGPALYDGA